MYKNLLLDHITDAEEYANFGEEGGMQLKRTLSHCQYATF